VSHNMAVVRQLCSRAILLDHGKMIGDGTADETVTQYLQGLKTQEGVSIADRTNRTGSGQARILNFAVGTKPEELGEKTFCDYGGPLYVQVKYRIDEDQTEPVIMLGISDPMENTVCQFSTKVANQGFAPKSGEGTVQFFIPNLYLVPGAYSLYVTIGNKSGRIFDDLRNLAEIHVYNENDASHRDFSGGYFYRVLFPFEWKQI
nr:Wzt carbohydrate-binding domain-containing protein [Thermoguttaceae bacterium]